MSDDDELEHDWAEKLTKWKKSYTQLTVDMIRKYFWDPIAKKGKPIIYFDTQDLEYGGEWQTRTPTGVLIIDYKKRINDWLSTSTSGPYLKNGSNGNTFYHLEFEEEVDGGYTLQIGWNGGDHKKVNNYITADALDGVDCWVSNEWLKKVIVV